MMPVLHDVWLYIHTNVIIFSYCLIAMAAASALLYVGARIIKAFRGENGSGDYARVGGAASLIMTAPDGGAYLARAKTSFAQVLDGTTMILLEMAFVFLWTGLVMGAIWADHSWGRPWGWDPKEVFALNTFLIFAVLVHARLKARDKGMWTAVLALIGCGVMIFNWVVINFTIAGLHSYA
jgi:ABC-type transport system involved in cytochrome c biogenesis permease subunit